MKKHLLIFVLLAGFQINLHSQDEVLELCASPRIENDQVHLDVIAYNFTDIVSFQFGVAWELDNYSLVEVININEDLAAYSQSSFSPQFDNIPDDISLIRTVWFDPGGSAASIANASTLFTVVLDAVDINSTSEFGIVPDMWFDIEVYSGTLEEINPVIDGTSCTVLNFSSTGNQNLSDLNAVELYPNPVVNNINLEFAQADQRTITILNGTGNMATDVIFENGTSAKLNVEQLAAGVYHLKIISQSSGEVVIKTFIKQ